MAKVNLTVNQQVVPKEKTEPEPEKVQGRSFTSNTTKLLKHLDKLQLIQDGKPPSPVMAHISLINACNLTCSFCCFANRDMTDRLPTEKVKQALRAFKKIGITGIEFSVAGEEIVPNYIGDYLRMDTIEELVARKSGRSVAIDKSHNHVVDEITDFIKHPQYEPLYKVILETGRSIKATKSHSIYFYDKEIIKKPVSEAKVGDVVVVSTKLLEYKDIGLDPDYARLLGYFVAEGSFNKFEGRLRYIVFTFDKYESEKEYIDDVCSILTKMGCTPGVYHYKNKTVIQTGNQELCHRIYNEGTGEYAQSKRVPHCIFNSNNGVKMEFLKGLFAGDGNYRNNLYKKGKYQRSSLHLKTSSPLLQKTTSFLLEQMGICTTMINGVNRKRKIENRILEESPYYTININGYKNLIQLESVINWMGKELSHKNSTSPNIGYTKFKPTVIGDHIIGIKIISIEEVDREEFVYDISVGNTERFISSYGILCSNTGGGSPTLHPDFIEIASYTHELGFKLGLCTNGVRIGKDRPIKQDTTKLFSWIRLGMYGFYEGYDYDLSVYEGTDTKVSAAYVWDENLETSNNPNITGDWTDSNKKRLAKKFQTRENFIRMLDWVEANKIPCRIAFNAIKPVQETQKDIDSIRLIISEYEQSRGKKLQYAFLSDFNFKGERRNDHCYMHMVKPFLFTDGYIYACPSAELSLENNYNYVPTSQFKVCSIDEIEEYYSKPASVRHHACHYCKYAMQNELIDDIVTKTEHNEFA